MRILLDESLPRILARYLSEATVETVFDRGWAGLKNGELLDRAAGSFDVFMTADQNLPYQQNLRGHDIRVVVLASNIAEVIEIHREIQDVRVAGNSDLGARVLLDGIS